MDKITYLAELAEGLARWVPERERQDILRYYAEYFEEAGPDREAEVMAELGDPWALSCRLAVEGGYVTHEKAAAWRPGKTWPKVLIGAAVGLTVFALVFGMGLLAVNMMRTATHHVYAANEPVTVVDWGLSPVWEEYNVAYVEDDSSFTGYYSNSWTIAPFNSIDVDISLGNIQVIAGDCFALSIGRDEAKVGYEPTWEVIGGVLRLRDSDLPRQVLVDGWEDLKNLFGTNQLAVDVTITIPDGAVLDRVSVKTELGNVMLYGVTAETVTAETGLGDVNCYHAWYVRRLELTTGVGDVNLSMDEARDGLSISLKSGTGNVDATLCGYEEEYSYSLESGLGIVTVNGGHMGSSAVHKGSLPYRLNAESGTGTVSVYFNG